MKANDNIVLSDDQKNEMIIKLEEKFTEILNIMGFDVTEDQQIKETPGRIAKMYVNELFTGCYNVEPKLTTFENIKKDNTMIFVGPIAVKSVCSHHFVPFIGNAYIGYIPNKQIVGISKLARVVQYYMRRPQIQEELTHQILQHIISKLEPFGAGVFIEAQHMCMSIRGVEQENSMMKTFNLYGSFSNINIRNEFFSLIKV